MRKVFVAALCMICTTLAFSQIQTNAGVQYLMNQAKDVSQDFSDISNIYFFADSLASFDTSSGAGKVKWNRYRIAPRQAFNSNVYWPQRLRMLDFPDTQYDNDPILGIQIDRISPRTLRIRMNTSPITPKNDDATDIMFNGAPSKIDNAWNVSKEGNSITYSNDYGSLEIQRYPWRIIIKDKDGKIMTQTRTINDNDSTQIKILPFNFIKRGADNRRSINPVFSMSPGERIYGCGESFSSLNKAGQKVLLFVTDPQGPESEGQYKPIPFYFSNRGYGIFMHTSATVTADFGKTYIGAQSLYMDDEQMDFFVFFGNPKEILNEYTEITGKSPMLPLWTFGTWMSRISYFSQKEGLEIADKIRSNKIPCDVIHFDTGWFEVDWQCDYQFAKNRFPDPKGMLKKMKKMGFRTCLWQLPYFTPKNKFFQELVSNGMAVKNGDGTLPYEDAVLDLSNPQTVKWYQDKISNLIQQGVSAIKCDFGEAAPFDGIYYNGKSGRYEHNLYPLRYNKSLWEAVKGATAQRDNSDGEGVIWARSAWAGSQRYPLHWGGDAATTNMGMVGTLRGGLSLGLSGFSFWSHDMGGFVTTTPENLYRRWLPFGFLSSHTRAHGAPPTEPWLISSSFTDAFRKCAEMKYKFMPYVYAQAKDCSNRGLPMLRALFVEFPDDAGAWTVEDEYMFGSQILVCPLFEDAKGRTCYLPEGKWIDYQTNKVYDKGYQNIEVGEIPCIILVRDGSIIPHTKVAQCTDDIDWNNIEMKEYKADIQNCTGLIFKPGDSDVRTIGN